jgi:hypothetical protein
MMETDIKCIQRAAERIENAASRAIWDHRDYRGRWKGAELVEEMSRLGEHLGELCEKWFLLNDENHEPKSVTDSNVVHRLIQAAGADGLSKYELTRKTQGMAATVRQKAIETLLAEEAIAVETVSTRTTPKTIYRSRFLD